MALRLRARVCGETMSNLSESKLEIVRTLIQAAPDSAIRDLKTALASGDQRNEAMRLIYGMVNSEALNRRTRAAVFAPLMPLCTVRPEGAVGMFFPPSVPAHLWRALRDQAPTAVQSAIRVVSDVDIGDFTQSGFDALCLAAAAGLRTRANADYAAAADALERSQPKGVEAFAACLDLTPVARTALERLPDWLARMNEERIVAARLTFKDAVSVSEDAGPRLMEMLFAHLAEPWLILRLISVIMQRPADRYIANSEMASFGERLLDDIDKRLRRVSQLNVEGGAAAGAAAGNDVNIIALQVAEFDKAVDLSKEVPGGARLNHQKRSLSTAVESRLKAVEREVMAALPVDPAGHTRRGVRPPPRLRDPPDSMLIDYARAYLNFMHEIRGSADKLGYGARWTKTSESVQGRLDTYIEDLLDMLRSPEEGHDLERVRQFLALAAEFMGLATDDKAAQIVLRRVAAA